MSKVLKSVSWVLFLTVMLLGVPKIAGVIADVFDCGIIDPDGSFAWISVHHIAQAAIFLLLILGVRFANPLDFKLGWGDRKVGKHYVLRFTLLFSLYQIVAYALILLTKSFQPFVYPMTLKNVIGYLGFQLFLSGPSEELIFRAFAITMLGLVVKRRAFSEKTSLANVIAAVIFGLAHVRFSFAPFEVSYSIMQVLFSIGMGLLYGDCYEKSGSVFYPMMMHSIGNVLSVSTTVLITMLVQ